MNIAVASFIMLSCSIFSGKEALRCRNKIKHCIDLIYVRNNKLLDKWERSRLEQMNNCSSTKVMSPNYCAHVIIPDQSIFPTSMENTAERCVRKQGLL